MFIIVGSHMFSNEELDFILFLPVVSKKVLYLLDSRI